MEDDHDVGDDDVDLLDVAGQVGHAGEGFFDRLANDSGAVANRVTRDRLGWDFHVQLPRANGWREKFTLDTRPSEPSCFVQVKASIRRIRSWRLKLSVWERLVKERRPVFFAVVLFAPGDLISPREVFVVHLGEDLIANALRELRQVENDDAGTLNEHFMAFRWADSDRLAELSGRCLRESVLRHVGDDLRTYEDAKARMLETLGYDDEPMKCSLTVRAGSADELYEKIAAFAVGANPTLEADLVELTTSRFGIERTRTYGFSPEPAVLSGQGPDMHGEVTLTGTSRAVRSHLPCAVHLGGVFWRFLPAEHKRVRIVFDGGEIILRRHGSGEAVQLKISLPADGEKLSLAHAAQRARTCRAVLDPDGVEVVTRVQGRRVGAPIIVCAPDHEALDEYAGIILGAEEVSRIVGLGGAFEVEPHSLRRQRDLALFAAKEPAHAHFEVPEGHPARSERRGVVRVLRRFDLGNHSVFAFIAIAGPVVIDGTSGTISAVPEIASAAVVGQGEPLPDLHALAGCADELLWERGLMDR